MLFLCFSSSTPSVSDNTNIWKSVEKPDVDFVEFGSLFSKQPVKTKKLSQKKPDTKKPKEVGV